MSGFAASGCFAGSDGSRGSARFRVSISVVAASEEESHRAAASGGVVRIRSVADARYRGALGRRRIVGAGIAGHRASARSRPRGCSLSTARFAQRAVVIVSGTGVRRYRAALGVGRELGHSRSSGMAIAHSRDGITPGCTRRRRARMVHMQPVANRCKVWVIRTLAHRTPWAGGSASFTTG